MILCLKNCVHKIIVISLLFTSMAVVTATHNTSRYFPFLERPEDLVIKKRSHVTPVFFYINSSTAFRRGGGGGSIPELWGTYDLRDVIASLQTVNPAAQPVIAATGSNALSEKSIKFKVDSKVSGCGIGLNYQQNLQIAGLSAGIFLPVVAMNTIARYSFNRAASDPLFSNNLLTETQRFEQEQEVDKIRRLTHNQLSFVDNIWHQSGFGDIDLNLAWNKTFDHVLLMKTIDINVHGGCVIPTGFISDINQPTSLSIGANGHWGIYGDAMVQLELKQDWTLGFLFGGTYLFPHNRILRLSIGNEPTIFSGLKGLVNVKPGGTFKISPYFVLGNLTDGLDFQVRYTYLRHSKDRWNDVRDDKAIQSYLQAGRDVINQKESLSKWRAHYITLQLSYDSKIAMKQLLFDPTMFIGYDIPMSGNGIAKTHQLTTGVELHF